MNLSSIRAYCLTKAFSEEDFPFDEETLCFKVAGKIFGITNLSETSETLNLKCEPERAEELRERYESVRPGYHMNKKHWNTVNFISGEIPDSELRKMIDHSYDLVFQSLPARKRKELLDAGL